MGWDNLVAEMSDVGQLEFYSSRNNLFFLLLCPDQLWGLPSLVLNGCMGDAAGARSRLFTSI
jgi:hypothetical protein